MSIDPKRGEAETPASEDEQVEMAPEGTFAGTREKPVESDDGERVPDDDGDQGGGQN
jgi:hypothetical protein